MNDPLGTLNLTYSDFRNRVLWDKAVDFTGKGIHEENSDMHGSYVADIILRSTGSNVKILPIRAMFSRKTAVSSAKIGLAIEYAIDCNADIINLSLGSKGRSTSLSVAAKNCKERGVKVLASMGNDSECLENYVPASCDGVCAVGSINAITKRRSRFSNYGKFTDLVAVGEELSTSDDPNIEGKMLNGTSFSTPCVSAAVANLMSYGFEHLIETLEYYADDVDAEGYDQNTGYGLVNIMNVKEDQPDPDKRYGSDSSEFHIQSYSLVAEYDSGNLTIRLPEDKSEYGTKVSPTDFVLYLGENKLEYEKDYTLDKIDYENRQVTVYGNNINYLGHIRINYPVTPAALPKATVLSTVFGTKSYNTPAIKFSGAKLKKDRDYTVFYEDNTNVGTAKVTIEGKGNYTGTETLTFAIKKPNCRK